MFFPENMTFQYFFFDTDIGYFLQMIPIALIVGIAYFFYRKKKTPELGKGKIVAASLFPAYLAALLGLTLFMDFIMDGYYYLINHRSPYPVGEGGYTWFSFIYDFDVDFYRLFTSEQVGNILLFLPFGVLHPLFNRKSTWKRTFIMGFLTSFLIENIQPFMDRSFDLNDLILNTFGVALSTLVFYGIRRLIRRGKKQG